MPPINQGGTPNNSQQNGQGQGQGQSNQNSGQQNGQGGQGGQDGSQGQGQGQNGQQNGQGGQDGSQGATFEAWYAGQGAELKGLIDGHISGLRSALESERNDRKALNRQIAEMKGKAEKGSELETQLTALHSQLETLNQKTAFYEAAPGDLSNPRLAYLAASEAGHINAKTGAVDWPAMRSAFPELFSRKPAPPPANGGQGQGQGGNQGVPNMNAFIRRAAQRGG